MKRHDRYDDERLVRRARKLREWSSPNEADALILATCIGLVLWYVIGLAIAGLMS